MATGSSATESLSCGVGAGGKMTWDLDEVDESHVRMSLPLVPLASWL